MYLFLDVDGTIINYHAETPASALEALKKAQQNGHQLIVCTGCSDLSFSFDAGTVYAFC